jgi:hypothetical protein
VLCQLQAVHRLSNAESTERFADWLIGRSSAYKRSLMALRIALPFPPETLTLRDHLAVAAWAQMGRFERPNEQSSPLWRLDKLREATELGFTWQREQGFVDLLARWDSVVGTNSLDDLETSSRALQELVDRTVARHEAHPGVLTGAAAAALRAYHNAHMAMKDAFLADPDAYVDPAAYAERADSYPRPAVAARWTEPAPGYDDRRRHDYVDITPAG